MGASAILRQVAAGDNNSTAAILAHLDKVLASDAFRRAERLSRFLRFTVEGVVRGEAHRIKEYVLGLEIFGRNQDYDPRLDPVVRVEARRLRAKLQEYYEQEGRDDAVRFVFPKGTYVPIFQTRVATETRPRGRLAVAAAIVFVAAVGLFSLAKYEITGPAPLRLAVVPMRAYAPPDPEEHQRLADSVAEAVLRELSRDRMLSLVSWPTVAAVRAHDGNSGALADQGIRFPELRTDHRRSLAPQMADGVVRTAVQPSSRRARSSHQGKWRNALRRRTDERSDETRVTLLRRLAIGPSRMPHLREHQPGAPDGDHVPFFQDVLLNPLSVDQRPVAAAEIHDDPVAVYVLEEGVLAAAMFVVQSHLAIGRAANRVATVQGEREDARVAARLVEKQLGRRMRRRDLIVETVHSGTGTCPSAGSSDVAPRNETSRPKL
jgi:hypothetical protein